MWQYFMLSRVNRLKSSSLNCVLCRVLCYQGSPLELITRIFLNVISFDVTLLKVILTRIIASGVSKLLQTLYTPSPSNLLFFEKKPGYVPGLSMTLFSSPLLCMPQKCQGWQTVLIFRFRIFQKPSEQFLFATPSKNDFFMDKTVDN